MTQPAQTVSMIIGGVDTHKDTHLAAALDQVGRVLGTQQFAATADGYQALLAWLGGFGQLQAVGVEGTGAYGAGLAAHLRDHGIVTVEVDRPDRKTRRWQGKSDPVDAIAAARAVLAQRATGIPKQRDGRVESLRALRVARRSAVRERVRLLAMVQSLVVTAPAALREQLRGLRVADLVTHCAGDQPERSAAAVDTPVVGCRLALGSLARRIQRLDTEVAGLDELLGPLVGRINPRLLARTGIGPDVAGQLLVTAGDNPTRLRSEAAFAMLCAAAPLPASSGRHTRHRLNRGGDRQANAALYRIVLCRLRWDPRTRAYAARRTAEGRSKAEIIRCLKRYIAREVYDDLINPQPGQPNQPATPDPACHP